MRRIAQIAPAIVVTAFVVAQLVPATSSSFTDTTAAKGNAVSAAADWMGPEVGEVVIQKTEGGATGKIRPGGRFYVYAQADDSGNPASGMQSVIGSLSSVTTTSQPTLSAGSWTVNGTTYGYRSAQLTARNWIAAGDHEYSVTARDVAENAPTTKAGTVALASGAFHGADVLTADGGGNTGLVQNGDRLSFVYDRAPEPASLVPGWDGAPTTIGVLLVDGALYGLSGHADLMAPVDDAGQLVGLGYVVLNGDYISKHRTATFSGSELTLDGETVTVTLANQSGSTRDDNNNRRPSWNPSAEAYDEFGVHAGTSPVSQTGSWHRQF